MKVEELKEESLKIKKDIEAKRSEIKKELLMVKGNITEENLKEKISNLYDVVYSEMDSIYNSVGRRVDYLENRFYDYTYEHQKNHPPHPKSATQMKKAISAFGMEDDIEVIKQRVLASKDSNLNEFLKERM